MKTTMTIMCLLGLLFFTACSKDDDNTNRKPVDEEETLKGSEKQITSFVFETGINNILTEKVPATIAENNNTISAIVPYGIDITALIPTIQISDKASISPSGAQDFNSPVTYTITAEDGTKATYNVIITPASNTENSILSFQFFLSKNPFDVNVIAKIDEETKLITFDIPDGADISALSPTIQISSDATISPEGLQNFEDRVTYTVTGQDGSTTEYEVKAILSQRGVLWAIYKANPNNTLDWDIESNAIGNWEGVTTDAEGFITELNLSSKGLSTLPPEIESLTNLIILKLNNNDLAQVPSEVGNLTNLTELYIPLNQLTEVPQEIGTLSNLVRLDLTGNDIVELPIQIGQLTNLQSLYLNSNSLKTIPPQIGQLSKLFNLYLSGNELTHLPGEIGQLNRLGDLWLSHNSFTHLPEEIAQLASLQQLLLNYNSFSELPPEIPRLTNLKSLNLSNNALAEIPEEIGSLANLTTLNLADNSMEEITPQIGKLLTLSALFLRGNQLLEIPIQIGNLTNLTSLYLNKNKLTQLPSEIGNLTNLNQLSLKENQLITIPQAVCDLETDHGTTILNDVGVTCK